LQRTVAEVVGFRGKIVYDPSKPDGTPRKLVDVSRLGAMAGTPRFRFVKGLGKRMPLF
jgi:GDP-L-fucose synthase